MNTVRDCALRAVATILLSAALAAVAAPAADVAEDPALEVRVNALSAELRCLVCQNQSLADSHAELALQLKGQVRQLLREGRNEDEVIAYMTDRYGDFVRYRPPLKATTLVLWIGPAVLLILGLQLLRRAHQRPAEPAEPIDQAKADELLGLRSAVRNPDSVSEAGG